MIKSVISFLGLLFAIKTHAQSNVFIIFKTHPVAYTIKNFNLGFEIGKDSAHGRLNFHVFRQTSFPGMLFDQFEDDSGSEQKVSGLTYRLGYKYLFKPSANSSFYIEPQLRTGKTSGILNSPHSSSAGVDIFNTKTKANQYICLFGIQKLNHKNKKFAFDIYTGIGYYSANINNILKESTPATSLPIGYKFSYKNEGYKLYLGMSIGIAIR